MRIGTKSVLYGAHTFWLHPWFVARAWWILFGFPFDPRLWLAFFVHDLGYIGKPNMDGPEGESHVELGAQIMAIFGDRWRRECLLHSRFYSGRLGQSVSRLGIADKYAICLTPKWLWKWQVTATGEYREYLTADKYQENEENQGIRVLGNDPLGDILDRKYEWMVERLTKWLEEQMRGPIVGR